MVGDHMIEIDFAQNGGSVDLALGDSFQVCLRESPTTGYRWHIRSPESNILVIESDTFDTSQPALGAGGVRRWQFRAVQAGLARLEIENRRSWGTNVAETFRINARVAER